MTKTNPITRWGRKNNWDNDRINFSAKIKRSLLSKIESKRLKLSLSKSELVEQLLENWVNK